MLSGQHFGKACEPKRVTMRNGYVCDSDILSKQSKSRVSRCGLLVQVAEVCDSTPQFLGGDLVTCYIDSLTYDFVWV